MNELQSLTAQLKQSKAEGQERDHILKIDQQQDGSTHCAVYFGDDLTRELSGNYRMDYSNTEYEVSCKNDHCKTTMKYDLIEDIAPGDKIRVEEKYDNHSDHFNINLEFYDKNGNAVGNYEAELSPEYSQTEEFNFAIHDLIAI